MSVRRGLAPRRDLLVMTLAYLAGLLAAVYVGRTVHGLHPIIVAGAADLAATVVVFTFSVAYDNSSFYDAYWSVAPPLLAVYWMLGASPDVPAARQVLVLLLIFAWGTRLTLNWLRGWRGLHHEDWRYVQMRGQTGGAYWLVSFAALHLAPTVVVFLGCLPVYLAVARGTEPLGVLDVLAVLVTGGAIAIEAIADVQLHRFRATAARGSTLGSGLWGYSRHPNYFGEALFWWGLWLFGLAAVPGTLWWGAGALTITLMLWFVSIPLLDERMRASRPDYAERVARVSALVPWFPRR
jgi:steroid 5-alpha reductase family enzyme